MNKTILIGRLFKDVEVTQSQSGKSIAKTGIAVKREYKNAEGKYDSDFINLIAFGNTADFLGKYFSKGSMVAVVGKIQTGQYQNKEGKTVHTTDVLVDSAEFIESKSNANAAPKQEQGFDVNSGFETVSEDDLELPFH